MRLSAGVIGILIILGSFASSYNNVSQNAAHIMVIAVVKYTFHNILRLRLGNPTAEYD